MRRKLYLETFGCQMNVLDSELVLGQLRAQGYEPVDDRESADVILYNTCSVREHAEQKVWSRLGELRTRKAQEPHLVIGVIGCMAERDGTNIFGRFPHVDVLCGPGELDKLPALVHNAVVTNGQGTGARRRGGTKGRHVALMGATSRRSSTLAAAEDHLELLDLSRSVSPGDDVAQAYVRITRGCNKFCTYCVVPYTRGPEVHRPPQNIVDEVRKLADAGAKEVTLLGQTINHYAYKHGDGRTTSFAELLYEIHEAVPHLPRLRFVTSFPRDFTDGALQAMRDCERICRYLHVPAQHGNDRILKLMNRGYTAQSYYDFIDRARALMPDVSIASDFIVGFPTETDEEFQQTVDLVRYCRFKNSFIFKYSPRPGTTAIDRFADDVAEDVKRRRNNELLAVQQEVSAQNNREMVGKTVEVMVEGESKLVSRQASYPASKVELGWEKRSPEHVSSDVVPCTQLVGRTRGDQVVVFDGEPALKGELLDVEITDARGMTLFARPLRDALCSSRPGTRGSSMPSVSPYEREQIESLLRLSAPPTETQRGVGLHLMPATVEAMLVYDLAVAPALWENGINVVGTITAFDSDSDLRDVARWTATAEVVLADVSPGATDLMYTLGLCHGLGRCPMLLVRTPGRLPFNLRTLRHFDYEDMPEGLAALREQLTRAVRVFLAAARAARDG